MSQTPVRVLVVEDEPNIRELVCLHLRHEGYVCDGVADGQAGLAKAQDETWDLLVLDLMLPGLDGLSLCRAVRNGRLNADVPILMLTARREEADKVVGLESGADDYLTKPFGTGELLARMRVALRKQSSAANEPVFESKGLSVDFAHRLVTVNGQEVQLTPTEYDLLKVLVTYAGKVITHHQLLRQVWGDGYDDMHILRVNISNLRGKIEPDPSRPTYIHTEPGVGYRLKI